MIKVSKVGTRRLVTNPMTAQKTEMIAIIFTEYGRSGGNSQMGDTSAFLDGLVGGKTGLPTQRTHTHLVNIASEGSFPVDKELAGYINRSLYSTAQTGQQEGVDARMIDGRPTYFTTYISANPEADRDLRVSNEALITASPQTFLRARVRGTSVEILQDFQEHLLPQEALHE